MATSHVHRWAPQDTIQSVAAQFLAQSGWADRATFEEQIQLATTTYGTRATVNGVPLPVTNRIIDWDDGSLVGAPITLPFST